eukprot:CAMPEP_0204825868 /NCGR_PEP_ID=MMETSP1346-20131115/3666_1 /ASSEMBLY_ACC=CAM_ASM_000771 /TAXON_ID=215587 /ORGANISM="Aplanochytrium stocchinoi, Strain GSBS06" /LENGTH=291 /DNA_ID=CAMNT_0051953643 /DNA_START=133 /DNA_END=1008 /DNA_ORIENTATION=+
MSDESWAPPQTIDELYKAFQPGHVFAGINRPTAGARDDKSVDVGAAPFQLYSLATPNGQKAGILLEELDIPYDAHVINIGRGMQFSKGFVDINPNSKIPAATDTVNGKKLNLFESGSIMFYLAEKYNKFIPPKEEIEKRASCMNWMNWAQVQAFVTGNYGHFFVYAPDNEVGARNYGVNRYGMEVQRLCSVLDQHLANNKYMCGDQYTIADMACLPWFDLLRKQGYHHKDGVKTMDFLRMKQYKHANRWADMLCERPEVQRGMLVTRGHPKPWLNPDDTRFSHLKGKKSKM